MEIHSCQIGNENLEESRRAAYEARELTYRAVEANAWGFALIPTNQEVVIQHVEVFFRSSFIEDRRAILDPARPVLYFQNLLPGLEEYARSTAEIVDKRIVYRDPDVTAVIETEYIFRGTRLLNRSVYQVSPRIAADPPVIKAISFAQPGPSAVRPLTEADGVKFRVMSLGPLLFSKGAGTRIVVDAEKEWSLLRRSDGAP